MSTRSHQLRKAVAVTVTAAALSFTVAGTAQAAPVTDAHRGITKSDGFTVSQLDPTQLPTDGPNSTTDIQQMLESYEQQVTEAMNILQQQDENKKHIIQQLGDVDNGR